MIDTNLTARVRDIVKARLAEGAYPCEDGTPAGDVNLDDEVTFSEDPKDRDFFVWYALRNARGTEASLRSPARQRPPPSPSE